MGSSCAGANVYATFGGDCLLRQSHFDRRARVTFWKRGEEYARTTRIVLQSAGSERRRCMTAEPDPYLMKEPRAHRLLFGWWLTRDDGIARHYPPRAWEELVRLRVENAELAQKLTEAEALARAPRVKSGLSARLVSKP
jgi:hypothetical protein